MWKALRWAQTFFRGAKSFSRLSEDDCCLVYDGHTCIMAAPPSSTLSSVPSGPPGTLAAGPEVAEPDIVGIASMKVVLC